MSDIVSRPYHLDPAKACEACIFNSPVPHAEWCPKVRGFPFPVILDPTMPRNVVMIVGRDPDNPRQLKEVGRIVNLAEPQERA